MNHQFEPTQVSTKYAAPVTGMSQVPDPRVEDYLDHVCAPMIGHFSYEERMARRTALREAMEPVIAAHVELGASRDEAVRMTLAQLRAESETVVIPKASPRVHQVGAPIAFQSFATAWVVAMLSLFLMQDSFRPGEIVLISTTLLWAPLIAGVSTELRGSKAPWRGMFKSMAMLAIPNLLLTSLWAGGRIGEPGIGLRITLMMAAGWSVAGTAGIGIGKLYRAFKDPETRHKIRRKLAALASD
jgi:hypothetical protein